MPNGFKSPIRVGFMGLTDCAPIVIARELGLDHKFGLEINPIRLSSWAAMRDHLAFENLECAHMLGGLTLAMHIGLGGLKTEMSVPLMLGHGGNAVTISSQLYDEAITLAKGRNIFNRAESATLLKAVVSERRRQEEPVLRLAVVHAFSSHNYELRAWLAHGGINPDTDVELIVIPPPKMIDALRAGIIDGYCVGEPWSQMAVEEGLGRIMVTKTDLYPNSPEKVLAFRQSWVTGHPETTASLVQIFSAAMDWAAKPSNRQELAIMLAAPAYLDTDPEIILHGLMGTPRLIKGDTRQVIDGYLSFSGVGCSYPHQSAALWLLAQMRRWGQVEGGYSDTVQSIFNPSILEHHMHSSGEKKFQLGHSPQSTPFDGVNFDGTNIESYWQSFPITAGY